LKTNGSGSVRSASTSVIRRFIISGLALAFVIGLMGCASTKTRPLTYTESEKHRPLALSEEFRARLTTIGIASVSSLPEAQWEFPAKGALGGFGRGAKEGGLVGALPGLSAAPGGPQGAVIAIPLAAAGAIVGALVGGIYGAFEAEPSTKVEEAEATLTQAIAALRIQETLREHVLKKSREETRYRVVLVTERSTPDKDTDATDFNHLQDKAIGVLLGTNVQSFGLTRESIGPNPRLAMFMKVRVKLMGTGDAKLFYDEVFEYKSEFHEYTQWTDDGGQRFLNALNEGYERLAAQIVYELFLLYLFPPRQYDGGYLDAGL
jgi:hypothetical protein